MAENKTAETAPEAPMEEYLLSDLYLKKVPASEISMAEKYKARK